MNKERTAINLNSVVIFDGDVTDENLKIIPEDFRGDIVVHGDMTVKEYYCTIIPCSLWVSGNIQTGDINVAGDFCCERTINAGDINVTGDFYCKGYIRASDINVAGDFYGKGIINADDINVAGDFYYEREVYFDVMDVEGKIYQE